MNNDDHVHLIKWEDEYAKWFNDPDIGEKIMFLDQLSQDERFRIIHHMRTFFMLLDKEIEKNKQDTKQETNHKTIKGDT